MPLNLVPLLSQNTIVTKEQMQKRLVITDADEYGWCQVGFVKEIERQYNQRKPVRIIVLKARQLGISTVTEAVLFNWLFIHPHTTSLVVTHEQKATLNLFGKTKLYWDTWPFKARYHQKYSTKFGFDLSNGSGISVATAKNVQSGRSFTIHALHLSEFAFYPDPLGLMSGLNQTVPDTHGSIIVIESTAQGTGNMFHEMWEQAVEGEIDYAPLFFPWWMHPSYRNYATHISKNELDDYEEWLLNHLTVTGYEDHLGEAHIITDQEALQSIAWRRWAIPNKLYGDEVKFMEEYPATPQEAFQATGRPVFPQRPLFDCYIKPERAAKGYLRDAPNGSVEFVSDPHGELMIYKAPSRRDKRPDRYFVAGDPTRSIEGDPACMQIINRGTFEQVAVWHGHIDPVTFAHEMIKVGKYYNHCMLCPEVEGGGYATIGVILDHNYPNIWMHRWADRAPGKLGHAYGWLTNWSRKNWSIGVLKKLILDGSIILHDGQTVSQLRYFNIRNDGEMGNGSRNRHDDAVMALAICVTASITEGPFMDDRVGSGPILDLFTQSQEDNPWEEYNPQDLDYAAL